MLRACARCMDDEPRRRTSSLRPCSPSAPLPPSSPPPTRSTRSLPSPRRSASPHPPRPPHLLRLRAATEQHGPHTVIATWSADRSPPRVAALLVDRRAVVDSDAETLRSLAAAPARHDASADADADADAILTHARWL